jgi:hypothetical protein
MEKTVKAYISMGCAGGRSLMEQAALFSGRARLPELAYYEIARIEAERAQSGPVVGVECQAAIAPQNIKEAASAAIEQWLAEEDHDDM